MGYILAHTIQSILTVLLFKSRYFSDSMQDVGLPLYKNPLLDIICAYMYVCFKALKTAMVLYARSQDLLLSLSVRRVHVVFLTNGCTHRGKQCPETRETAALRGAIQKASHSMSVNIMLSMLSHCITVN